MTCHTNNIRDGSWSITTTPYTKYKNLTVIIRVLKDKNSTWAIALSESPK